MGLTSTKHHYTPRYYLKRFRGTEGKIWRRDVGTGVIVTGNHAHFGCKNHWNRLQNPPQGYASDWAEKRIAEVDGFASATLTKLVEGKFPQDLRSLAYAMGFMKMHQPKLHRELAAEYPESTADWSSDIKLIASLKAAMDEGKRLQPLGYSIIRIDDRQTGMRFLTSSNPLVEFDNKPNSFFPLSSRDCLLLIYDPILARTRPQFVRGTAETVRGINGLTLRNAWQYVYSCRPDFDA